MNQIINNKMKELTKEYKELLTKFSIKEFDMIPITNDHFRMIEVEYKDAIRLLTVQIRLVIDNINVTNNK